MKIKKERIKASDLELTEKVVATGRISKAVEGGRTLKFRALVVLGNKNGIVGVGMKKSKEVSDAIRKANQEGRKDLIKIPIWRGTIPHKVEGKFRGAKVFLQPASPGTGVIAGGGVRAVLNCLGVQNILSKSLGSTNPHNLVRATLAALSKLCDPLMVARRRGISLDKVFNG